MDAPRRDEFASWPHLEASEDAWAVLHPGIRACRPNGSMADVDVAPQIGSAMYPAFLVPNVFFGEIRQISRHLDLTKACFIYGILTKNCSGFGPPKPTWSPSKMIEMDRMLEAVAFYQGIIPHSSNG
jgi:hypothetical protein